MASQGNPGTHVTVIGVLETIWGSVVALGGLILLVAGTAMQATFEKAFESTGGLWALLGGMIMVLGLIMAVIGAGAIVASIGLFQRKPWGRVLTFVYAALALASGIMSVIGLDIVGAVLSLGWGAYAFWALTRPEVVAQFQGAPMVRPGAPV